MKMKYKFYLVIIILRIINLFYQMIMVTIIKHNINLNLNNLHYYMK